MKIINRPLLTALLLSSLVSLQPAVRAAENTSADDRAERFRERLQKISQELNLTADQKEQLKPIIQTEVGKLKALHADTSLTRAQKIEKFKAIREETAPEVKAILTPEQLAKWQTIRAEYRAKSGQPPQPQ